MLGPLSIEDEVVRETPKTRPNLSGPGRPKSAGFCPDFGHVLPKVPIFVRNGGTASKKSLRLAGLTLRLTESGPGPVSMAPIFVRNHERPSQKSPKFCPSCGRLFPIFPPVFVRITGRPRPLLTGVLCWPVLASRFSHLRLRRFFHFRY